AVDAALVVVIALVPVDEVLEQLVADDRPGLLEDGRAHVVADAAGPDQVDVGGVLRARHLDPARGEVRVEVTAFGQPAADADLAGLVVGVVEDRAGRRDEVGQVRLQVTVLAALADDRDIGIAHAHRFAGVDADGHRHAVVGTVALDLDDRRIETERLQRFARLALGRAHQVAHAAPADLLPGRVDQRQRPAHVVLHLLVEAEDAYLAHGHGMRGAEREEHEHGNGGNAAGESHRGRIPKGCRRTINGTRQRRLAMGLATSRSAPTAGRRGNEAGALRSGPSRLPRNTGYQATVPWLRAGLPCACGATKWNGRSAPTPPLGGVGRWKAAATPPPRQTDRCSIAATLPSRAARRDSRARRLRRTASSSTFTITSSKNASTCG